jgi:hypothetical protein
MKLVSGGQRSFSGSALSSMRISGLFADTYLVPDPIYPYFFGDLRLNARHLQLAINLYYILQLQPLVAASLPVPPVIVFPSFEEILEANDAQTKRGIEDLIVKVVGPICEGSISSVEEIGQYAMQFEGKF